MTELGVQVIGMVGHRILKLFVQNKKSLVPWAVVENPETWPLFWVYISWKVIIEKQRKDC